MTDIIAKFAINVKSVKTIFKCLCFKYTLNLLTLDKFGGMVKPIYLSKKLPALKYIDLKEQTNSREQRVELAVSRDISCENKLSCVTLLST